MEGPSRRGRGPFWSSPPDCQLRGGFGTWVWRPVLSTSLLCSRPPEDCQNLPARAAGRSSSARLMFPRRQDRIWSRPRYTTSGSPGSANSRSAPGFWNSALFAYCLRGCGKHGWRQTALHSPRISVCELNQHKVKGNSSVSTIVLAACGSPF